MSYRAKEAASEEKAADKVEKCAAAKAKKAAEKETKAEAKKAKRGKPPVAENITEEAAFDIIEEVEEQS